MRSRTMALLAGVLLVALSLGFLAGTTVGDRARTGAAGDHPTPAEVSGPMNDFWRAYDLLNQDSYWAPLDKKKLIYAAINGMLSGGTGDAHTTFLAPDDNAVAQTSLDGTLDGIGAYVDLTTQGIVLTPLKDSPAMRAGLRAKDVITHIDDVEVNGMSQTTAIKRLRGKAGTTVKLTVVRTGVAEPFRVLVTRGHITIPSVTGTMYGTIAYLRIVEFGSTADTEVIKTLNGLLARHPRGLVVDLRDNPGGYVPVVVHIASQFLAAGAPVMWEQKNDKTQTSLTAQAGGVVPMLPMAVLVNSGSASASEILAGALKDYHRATVIGTQTFGKGSMQEDISFDDGAAARITIRLWRTPKQHLIQGIGITPDVVVASPTDPSQQGTPSDAPLNRALTILRK